MILWQAVKGNLIGPEPQGKEPLEKLWSQEVAVRRRGGADPPVNLREKRDDPLRPHEGLAAEEADIEPLALKSAYEIRKEFGVIIAVHRALIVVLIAVAAAEVAPAARGEEHHERIVLQGLQVALKGIPVIGHAPLLREDVAVFPEVAEVIITEVKDFNAGDPPVRILLRADLIASQHHVLSVLPVVPDEAFAVLQDGRLGAGVKKGVFFRHSAYLMVDWAAAQE